MHVDALMTFQSWVYQKKKKLTLAKCTKRLENAGIHVKNNKCSMLPEVQYLGLKISAKGLEPTDESPTSENMTQLISSNI